MTIRSFEDSGAGLGVMIQHSTPRVRATGFAGIAFVLLALASCGTLVPAAPTAEPLTGTYTATGGGGALTAVQARLADSARAKVDVYQGANLIATFFPPRGQRGTVWAVFQLEGSTLTPIQQFIRLQDFSDVPADFMRVGTPPANAPDGDSGRVMSDVRRHPTRGEEA